jgi:hypothetical protein
MSLARKFFNEMPAEAHLDAMDRPLNEGERRAMAFLHGALNLANRHGLLRADIKNEDMELEFDFSDSTSISEDDGEFVAETKK